MFFSDKCTKDILVIIDTSGSVGRSMFEDRIKPFLYRLFADNTLDVSPNGSNFAIMVFSTKNKTKLLVSFEKDVYQKSLIEIVQRLDYTEWAGGETRTDLALQMANQVCTRFMNHLMSIYQKVSPTTINFADFCSRSRYS